MLAADCLGGGRIRGGNLVLQEDGNAGCGVSGYSAQRHPYVTDVRLYSWRNVQPSPFFQSPVVQCFPLYETPAHGFKHISNLFCSKRKGHPITKARKGSRCTPLSFFNLGDRWGWSKSRSGRFTPGIRPGANCIRGWVGPTASLDGCGKSRPSPCLDPRTTQPVASRYTD